MSPAGLSSSRTGACLIALSVLVLGCSDEETAGKLEAALAYPGPWQIPDGTVALGDIQSVSYTGAGPWIGEAGCGGSLLEGTRTLGQWLETQFPQILEVGGYSCRPIVGNSSQTSVHGTGRAVDLMLPLSGGDADNDLGDPIGNYLIEHAEEIGVQLIIWDRWQWNGSRSAGSKSRSYGGSHPHHDHLHVELTPEAAAMMTPWFVGTPSAPTSDACQVAATGSEIEETEPCVKLFGDSAYWRNVAGSGHGGSLVWTNAFESSSPSNWARWHLDFVQAGTYGVEVYVEAGYGIHQATRYMVMHNDTETEVTIDQSLGGWISLGMFDFAAGGGQHLNLYDNSLTPVASNQQIAVDAIRLVPAGATPPTDPVNPPTEPTDPMTPGAPVDSGVPANPMNPFAQPDSGGVTEGDGTMPRDGGCRAGGTGPGWPIVLGLALFWRRRSRSA